MPAHKCASRAGTRSVLSTDRAAAPPFRRPAARLRCRMVFQPRLPGGEPTPPRRRRLRLKRHRLRNERPRRLCLFSPLPVGDRGASQRSSQPPSRWQAPAVRPRDHSAENAVPRLLLSRQSETPPSPTKPPIHQPCPLPILSRRGARYSILSYANYSATSSLLLLLWSALNLSSGAKGGIELGGILTRS